MKTIKIPVREEFDDFGAEDKVIEADIEQIQLENYEAKHENDKDN